MSELNLHVPLTTKSVHLHCHLSTETELTPSPALAAAAPRRLQSTTHSHQSNCELEGPRGRCSSSQTFGKDFCCCCAAAAGVTWVELHSTPLSRRLAESRVVTGPWVRSRGAW